MPHYHGKLSEIPALTRHGGIAFLAPVAINLLPDMRLCLSPCELQGSEVAHFALDVGCTLFQHIPIKRGIYFSALAGRKHQWANSMKGFIWFTQKVIVW